MHLFTRVLIGVLSAALTTTACERGAASSAAAPPSESPAAKGTAGPSTAAGIATTGSGETAAPAATWREVTIPAGTTLRVALDTTIGSDTSRIEDPVRARLTRAVVIDGVTVVPEGSTVGGVVTAATRAGKTKGTSRLAVRFDSLAPARSDERYRIETSTVARTGPTQKKKDALEIAAPAAGGAIIGGIVGGKKGAAIGGAAGGGAGTAVVLTQRGKDVRLGKGAALTLRLTEPVTIRVRG